MKVYKRDSVSGYWVGSDGVRYILKNSDEFGKIPAGFSIELKPVGAVNALPVTESVRVRFGSLVAPVSRNKPAAYCEFASTLARRLPDNVLSVQRSCFEDHLNSAKQRTGKTIQIYVSYWWGSEPCVFSVVNKSDTRVFLRPFSCGYASIPEGGAA